MVRRLQMSVWSAGLVCVFFTTGTVFSQQVPGADLAQGRELVARLSASTPPDISADDALFHQVGYDQAVKALLAVQSQGSGPAATSEDWLAMHRALTGLVELFTAQKQYLKAGIFATLQESAYIRCEGDYNAAFAAARQALDLQQQSGELATLYLPWKNIAQDLIHLGRIKEGEAAFAQAHSLLHGSTDSMAGDLWRELIAAESSNGDSAAAHKESEEFLRAAGPATPPAFRAYSLLAAADVAMDDHRYADATARIHESLRAIKGDPNPTLFGYEALNTLLTLGLQAIDSMPYDQALSFCKSLDKDFPGMPVPMSSFAHEILNHRRRLAGQFDLVLRDDSDELTRARTAKELSGQVSALLSTALDYSYLREWNQEITALTEAAEIVRSPAGATLSPHLRFRILNSLGEAERQNGDLRIARDAYLEVLSGIEAIPAAQLRGDLGTLYADAELGKAAVLERDGKLDDARDLLRKMLQPEAPGHATRSSVLLQWASLEQNAAQPADAIRLYLEAIDALRQEKNVAWEIYARLQLAKYLATSDVPAEADAAHSKEPCGAVAREQLALARSESLSIGLEDSTWRIQYIEGLLDEKCGGKAAAIRSYGGAITALDRIRAGLSQEDERRSFVDSDSTQDLYRRQVALLTAAGDSKGAWEVLERNKARSFLESLHGRRFAPAAAGAANAAVAAAELDGLEQQILAARASLTSDGETALRGSGRSPEALRAKLASLEARFALAREQQNVGDSRSTEPLALRPLSLADTQARLPQGAALIEYAILDHEMAAFVVTHDAAKEVYWTADTASLPGQILRLRAQLASSRRSANLDAKLDASLDAAAKILLTPVLRVLPAQVNALILVPTGALASIPFEALPLPGSTSHPARQLIDRFTIAYLPSASTLQFLRFGPASASPDLFLGALGDVSVEGWPALPGTLEETAAIQALYPRAVRVTGAAFTHDAAIDALLHHKEVHFATHGLFDEQSPLFSALITGPEAGQPARLSLYEVMDLNIQSRLVILSACETDRGQSIAGDEIVGFTRTFLQAGAESVVSSLWKVDDASTAFLMQSLHAHLRRGELTPVALRHAQLETRRKFPNPFYWSAFVATGLR
ncbi:MAG TPA: CHAT domain-containing protein [Terracidiphilus sp.]|nr:CHAT domain-containing protein [Terracidiphilus sp.]